jgi:hypothetical protein
MTNGLAKDGKGNILQSNKSIEPYHVSEGRRAFGNAKLEIPIEAGNSGHTAVNTVTIGSTHFISKMFHVSTMQMN